MWCICGMWERENIKNCKDEPDRFYAVAIDGTEPLRAMQPISCSALCASPIELRDRPNVGKASLENYVALIMIWASVFDVA